MDINQIPQDKSKTYGGHAKVVYAVKNGSYTKATTSGWEDEEFVTLQAVDALAEQTQLAFHAVKNEQRSSLFYYMFLYRHDITSLAQTSGFFRWQIKRHFKPLVFKKLSDKKLNRYAQVFNLSIEQLKQLPTEDNQTQNNYPFK